MIVFNQETRQFSVVEDREFGWKSKTLGVISPGAWNAKEAAKYMYDTKDEYMKHRGEEALKGAFTPISSARRHERAKAMYERGASAKEIRESLDKRHLRTSGVSGALLGMGPGYSHGIYDAHDASRKKFD